MVGSGDPVCVPGHVPEIDHFVSKFFSEIAMHYSKVEWARKQIIQDLCHGTAIFAETLIPTRSASCVGQHLSENLSTCSRNLAAYQSNTASVHLLHMIEAVLNTFQKALFGLQTSLSQAFFGSTKVTVVQK